MPVLISEKLMEAIRRRYKAKSGIILSKENLLQLTTYASEGICRILAREGYINLAQLGHIEYDILEKKEVRFERKGLPIVLPTKVKFSWSPSEALHDRIKLKVKGETKLNSSQVWRYLDSLK